MQKLDTQSYHTELKGIYYNQVIIMKKKINFYTWIIKRTSNLDINSLPNPLIPLDQLLRGLAPHV